ncbi:hypothetical protein [Desulfobacter postgatei]|mgnify:CR=1 FL=1|uniref:hypothetical protein n=1 Tax=Desulfobacter postgatei TaxID=2293 RepID=UPI00259BDBBE|nr:hypothetical protein [uncultured Desulfobacter sp.]
MSEISKIIKVSKLNKNQKVRWNKKGIIPNQVLIAFWDQKVRFSNSEPRTGMKIDTFIEKLWELAHTTEDSLLSDVAMYLYTDTVENEWKPNWRSQIRKRTKQTGTRI